MRNLIIWTLWEFFGKKLKSSPELSKMEASIRKFKYPKFPRNLHPSIKSSQQFAPIK
jgi:hypothetical protein